MFGSPWLFVICIRGTSISALCVICCNRIRATVQWQQAASQAPPGFARGEKKRMAELQLEKLKSLKNKKNLSNRELAEMTGLSESTISRIITGQTEPRFSDVAEIAKVIGASLDDLAGIQAPAAADAACLMTKIEHKEKLLESSQVTIKVLTESSNRERHDKRALAIALAVLIAFLLTVVAVDLANGNIGWARYATGYHQSSASPSALLSAITNFLHL